MNKAPPSFFFAVFGMLFLAICYFTVTNMAGIYIVSDLGGSQELSVYPMVFYGLGNALTIPLSAYLHQRLGARTLVVRFLLAYAFFSICCSLASTLFVFNLYRFGLGLSAGPFFYLSRMWSGRYLAGKQLDLFNSIAILMYAIVPVAGACAGATLAYETFWRWIFHLNVPFSLLLALYFWRKKFETEERLKIPLDVCGYIAYCTVAICLVSAVAMAQQLDWFTSNIINALLLLGTTSLFFFVGWELYHPHPILNFRLLKNKALSYILLNLGALFSTYFGMIILIALWLQIYVNYTPDWIAAILATMGFAGAVGFVLLRYGMRYVDPRIPLGIAIAMIGASCIYSTYFNSEINFGRLAIARFLAGFGLVLFLVPLFREAFACCAKEEEQDVFVWFQAVRVFSSSLGAGFYVLLWQRRQAFFHERLGEQLTISSPLTQDYFRRATQIFGLTKTQATEQLNVLLDQQATSLALNDVFGFMAWILGCLFLLLVASFLKRKFVRA